MTTTSEPITLPSRLRAFYAEHTRDRPCTLSVPELAARFCPNAKHGERAVRRAHRLIAETYGARFHQHARSYRRMTMTAARWIDGPGAKGTSRSRSSGRRSDQPGDLELQADADRARTRPRNSAPRSTPRVRGENERAREGGGSVPRRRAVPHGVSNPVLLEAVAVPPEALAALRGRFPAAFDELVRELHRERCHAHPLEACRAARTLAERDTSTPLRLFRDLFRRAREGDLLIDAQAERDAVEAAELEARKAYGYDAADPSTHWPEFADQLGQPRYRPPPTAAELEAARMRRTVAARERELRATVTPRAHDPTAAQRFLASVRPEISTEILGGIGPPE